MPAIIETGAVDNVLTLTVILAQTVVLHTPCALTKYVEVNVGFTVKVVPEPIGAPAPQPPINHCQVAPVPKLPPRISNVTGSPAQIVAVEEFIPEGALDNVLTVMAIEAAAVVSHPSKRT